MTEERLAEIEARASAAASDAEFALRARFDVPALVAEVRRLRAELAGVPKRRECPNCNGDGSVQRLTCGQCRGDGVIEVPR